MNQLMQQNSSKVANISSFEMSQDNIQLLKNTICKGSSDNELQLFVHACKRSGLDPFMKQIHAVKRPERQVDGSYRQSMTIQTGIDGYRLIAERTRRYAPGKEPSYQYDKDGRLVSATAYVKKLTDDGTWHEVSATAFYEEYVQKTKDGKETKFWNQMKHNQIAKCAEALALRKAFPAELSGIYTVDEMAQASNLAISEETEAAIEDISNDKIEEHLNIWAKRGVDLECFKTFVDEMVDVRKWSYKKCFEAFEVKPEYTIKQFNEWLSKR